MANRLNVLVGAALEQNVEKKLNAELAKLNLNALELEAKFDNNFKDIVDNIKKAIAAVDFSKINNGLNQVPDVFDEIKKATNGIADGVKVVDKATRDLNGNLKTTEQRFKAIDNKELSVKVNYDDSGNINQDKSYFTITNSDGKARLDKQKQVLKLYEKTSEELLKQRDYLKDAHGWTLRSTHVDDAYKPKVLDNFINKTEKLGEKLRKNNLTIEQLLKLENELNKQANAASGYVDHVDFSQSERGKLYKRQLKYNSKEYEEALTQELRKTNQAIADAYADREKIHKQNADREQRAFDEEQKRNQEREQLLQNLYSTYTETERKTKSLSDTYGNLTDVDNKKFYKQAEANGYIKSLDTIAKKLVDNEHNTEALLEVQKELNDLQSKLDSRDKELDSQVKADNKAKVAREKYNEEVKKSKDLLSDLKKTATDSRTKLDNLKTAFPDADFSEEEKKVRSLEGAVESYERTVNATGKSTKYFVNQQRKLKGLNSTAGSTSRGLDSRLKQETKAAETAAKKTAQARFDAEEKYNKKLYSEHQKLISSYKEVSSAVDDIYKQSEIPSYFDKSQLKQIDKFGEELNEIEEILKKDNVATWELIRAQERLVSLQNDASDFVSKVNAQKLAQEKLTASIEKQTASVREQLALLDVQVQTKATKLGSRYGDLFNEEEFKQVYSLVDAIENELGQTEPDFKKINSYFKQMNANASKFEAELSASAKELKQIEDKAKVFDSSLGRFIQFYGFGELFRTAKTGFTQMFEQIKLVDSSMVELRKVTSETEETYELFLDKSADKAKALGVTMTDYIDSVTNFARMDVGGFEAAQQVAETANIFQQVSENLTADQASEYLISNMKAWGYQANETIEIVDILNNLSNKYAITIDGLGESLTRSSAAMMSANNTLEQTAALTIAANNVIQDPLVVGNALKTVSIKKLVA